jgi:Ca2+-binding EF-hand superfamily protein
MKKRIILILFLIIIYECKLWPFLFTKNENFDEKFCLVENFKQNKHVNKKIIKKKIKNEKNIKINKNEKNIKINKNESKKKFIKIKKKKKEKEEEEEEIYEDNFSFKKYDINKDGKISIKEMFETHKKYGDFKTLEEIKDLIKIFDVNNDNFLNKYEFDHINKDNIEETSIDE